MVSVAMAFYNGKTYIEEQIDSILRNLKEKDELVISVDDASDGSDQILKKRAQADMRIRVVKGPGNGVVPNFQNALRHCRGEIIVIADQDDVWKEKKVSKVLEAFQDPDVMCVVHNAEIVDGNLVSSGETTFQWRESGTGFWKNMKKNSYIGCCMAVRKEIYIRTPQKIAEERARIRGDKLKDFKQRWVSENKQFTDYENRHTFEWHLRNDRPFDESVDKVCSWIQIELDKRNEVIE